MRNSIGVRELCGDEVYDYGPLRAINAYTCGRCGRWVCTGCGGFSPGYGYGVEDESKYGQVCKQCYYELQAEYAAKWEAEFGSERERRIENPYDLSEEEEEWRRQMREYKAWRDSRERESSSPVVDSDHPEDLREFIAQDIRSCQDLSPPTRNRTF